MLHPEGPSKRRIRLDDYIMILAERGDLSPGVERMNFDLVNSGMYSRLRRK